ncbi:MAG: aminotransferase class IV [Acidobacteriota bacterium]
MLHNDQIRPVSDLGLSAGQTGLLNGWGVFSTIRVYDGVMFCWPRHFARMRHDARLMRVPFPTDAAWLEQRLLKLLDANQAHNATLRVAIVRNHGGAFQGDSIEREFDLIAFTAQVYNWGTSVRLGLIPHGRHAANEFAGVKYLSWAQNLTWYERAHEQGLDEVVLLNERGEVAECTSANIFTAFKTPSGVEVRTPPLSSGCLPGVTRALLLEEVQVPGIRVVEAVLHPADLEAADEVFITSTTRELLPVVHIAGLRLNPHALSAPSACDQLVIGLKSYIHQYVSTKTTKTSV